MAISGISGIVRGLIKLAPDILPLIISAIGDAETLFKGRGLGTAKKEAVMKVIRAAFDVKDYFMDAGAERKDEILELADGAVDLLVKAFNFVGLFDEEDKIDFTPKPFPVSEEPKLDKDSNPVDEGGE